MDTSLLLPVLLLLTLVYSIQSAPTRRSRAAAIPDEEVSDFGRQSKIEDVFKDTTTKVPAPTNRRNKALNLFRGFFPSFLSSGLDYAEDDDDDVTFSVNDDHFDEEDLSRTIPTKRKQEIKKKNNSGNSYQNNNMNSLQYENSPIFYIRLPPTPYMFVPGLGYVSQPPTLGSMAPMMPPGVPQQADPFINLPIDFVSNGKPTGVYQWSGAPGFPPSPQMDPFGYGPSQPTGHNLPPAHRPSYTPSYSKPKPAPTNSKITNLKGPYVFNGKPSDSVYVLRDSYNSIYSDALQNFYP